jgi:RNA polymerase sigma-70 factor (ECF subfamily)
MSEGDRSAARATPQPVVRTEHGRENLRHGVPVRLEARAGAEPGGDADRLRTALRDHHDLVWRLLRRLGVNQAELDDAVQHVFLTLSSRLSELASGNERRFLLGVCPGVAANARRRERRLRESEVTTETADLEGLTPEQLLDWKQRREALDVALLALSLDQRVVFVLFELEGFSLPEIAASLEIPLGTATSRLRRARSAFSEWVRAHHPKGPLK